MIRSFNPLLRIVAPVTLAAWLLPLAAQAQVRDSQIDGARECTQHFATHERLNGIPTHLLAAVSATESGRYNKTLGMVLPWPWTLNANGQGYYFDTKAEAVAKVRSLQASGVKSIDVGCMQVNLHHHPNAFANLEQALDPRYNIAYSAKFLRRNYDELGSWVKATAAYHSRTPKYGNLYLGRIEKSWRSIVDKVREARSSRGLKAGEYAAAGNASERDFTMLSRAFANQAGVVPISEVDKHAGLNAAARGQTPSRSMRVIEVSNVKDTSRSNVMVIRPKTAAPKISVKEAPADGQTNTRTTHVASANENLFVMNTQKPSSGSANRVTNTSASAKPASSSPKFVFVD